MEEFQFYMNCLNEILINNAIGKIILSIVSSFIFIFMLLKLMRPKILISPNICYKEFDGKMYYLFKIVNRSRFDLYDIHFRLIKKTPYIINNGKKINHRLTEIDISTNHMDHIPKYKKEKDYGEHAILIRTDYPLEDDIENSKINIRLTVTGRHGLTNLTRVVSQDYTTKKIIFKGKEFKFGRKLEVLE